MSNFVSWRDVLGFYDHVPLTKEEVQERYEQLIEMRRGDSYALSQLNEAWKKAQEECISSH